MSSRYKNFDFSTLVCNSVIVRVFKKGYPESSKYVRVVMSSPFYYISKKSFINMLRHFTKYSLEIVKGITMDKIDYDIYAYKIEDTFSNLKLGYFSEYTEEKKYFISEGKISIPEMFYIVGTINSYNHTFFHIESDNPDIMITQECLGKKLESLGLSFGKCSDRAKFPYSYFLRGNYKIIKAVSEKGINTYEILRIEVEETTTKKWVEL